MFLTCIVFVKKNLLSFYYIVDRLCCIVVKEIKILFNFSYLNFKYVLFKISNTFFRGHFCLFTFLLVSDSVILLTALLAFF